MLQNNPILKSLIDKLWNNFWSGGISNPLTAIEQITYLIFMKRLDELDTKRKRNADFIGEKYTSKFSDTYIPYVDESIYNNAIRPGAPEETNAKISAVREEAKKPRAKEELRWSVFKRMKAEDMLSHIQNNVFPFLKQLNGGGTPFTRHMANAVFIMPKASLLVEAIGIIEQIFAEIEKDANEGGQAFQDIQGDVYEMLLSEIATAGKNGQFRTPRHIIKLMTELIAPQLGQRIADPACGTAGFLLGAYQYMLTQLAYKTNPDAVSPDEDGFLRATVSAMLNDNLKSLIEDSLFGYDIDATMVRLGLMNLMMHGIDNPKIDYKDTLTKEYNENNQYDIVMANPPFKGSFDSGDRNPSLKVDTNKTELLFISRIFNMLKMGGTAAVIVPQGVLFGAGRAFVETRKMLVEEAELKAVISMPGGVFKPYAGVSTAILIFTKASETTKVWFYEMQNDGYSLDDKRNKRKESDLQEIIKKYQDRATLVSDRKEKYFLIAKKEIVENDYDLSLSKYRQEEYIEKHFDKPKDIFEKLKGIEENISKGITELEQLLQWNLKD
jgi:type I restriction enzyme M protein